MTKNKTQIGEMIQGIWQNALRWLRQMRDRLRHWLYGNSKPKTPEISIETENKPLNNSDYEYLFMQLLEGVEHGWRGGQVLKIFQALSERTAEEEWIAWLCGFGERLLTSPVPNYQLARRMVRLGDVGCGRFGEVARGIGLTLLARTPETHTVELLENPSGVDNKTQNAQELFHQGIRKFNAGDFLGAVTCYEKALEILPNAQEIWYNRGNALFKLGRTQDAIASYDKVLELKYDKYEAWNNRGNALYNLGCVEEALFSYDKAVEIQPDYHQGWFNRGVLLGNLGRLEDAIASYDKALEIKPQDDQAWFNRGLVLGNLGRLEDAIASWDKALEFNPERYEAWYNRSVALNSLGRSEEATASLNKAVVLKQDHD